LAIVYYLPAIIVDSGRFPFLQGKVLVSRGLAVELHDPLVERNILPIATGSLGADAQRANQNLGALLRAAGLELGGNRFADGYLVGTLDRLASFEGGSGTGKDRSSGDDDGIPGLERVSENRASPGVLGSDDCLSLFLLLR
jgi:hypothetical protein